jgi:hypothetical protein
VARPLMMIEALAPADLSAWHTRCPLIQTASAHSSARRHSTIDTVIRAGHELPAIRHEQRDGLGDVLGGADATQRNVPEPIIR